MGYSEAIQYKYQIESSINSTQSQLEAFDQLIVELRKKISTNQVEIDEIETAKANLSQSIPAYQKKLAESQKLLSKEEKELLERWNKYKKDCQEFQQQLLKLRRESQRIKEDGIALKHHIKLIGVDISVSQEQEDDRDLLRWSKLLIPIVAPDERISFWLELGDDRAKNYLTIGRQ